MILFNLFPFSRRIFGTLHAKRTHKSNGMVPQYELRIQGKCILTANSFFSQGPHQTQSPDIERGMMGILIHNRSPESKPSDDSTGNGPESFLNSLERLTKDYQRLPRNQGTGGETSSTFTKSNAADKSDAAVSVSSGLKAGIPATMKKPTENPDNGMNQTTLVSNLTTVVNTLESLGLFDSIGEGRSATKEADSSGKTGVLAALETLIIRLGQNEFETSAKMQAELERLQQIIANAGEHKALSPNDGYYWGELDDSQLTESPNLNPLVKKIVCGQENQRDSFGPLMGHSDLDQKPSGLYFPSDDIAAKLPNEVRQTGLLPPAEDSQAASGSEILQKIASIKSAAAALTVGDETTAEADVTGSLKPVRTDAPGKTGEPGRIELLMRALSTIESAKQIAGESAPQDLPNNGGSSVIKTTNDVQLPKEPSQRQNSTADLIPEKTSNQTPSSVSKTTSTVQATTLSIQRQSLPAGPITENSTHVDFPVLSKKENDAPAAKAPVQGQSATTGSIPEITIQNDASLISKMSNDTQTPKVLNYGTSLAGESAPDRLVNDGSSAVIKMIHEAQAAKDSSQRQNFTADLIPEKTAKNGALLVSQSANGAQAVKILSQGQRLAGELALDHSVNNNPTAAIKMIQVAQASKDSDPERRHGPEPAQHNASSNESSPVSKMIHAAQLVKESAGRTDTAMSDELGGKITKVDAGANDNGLLSTQNQTAEKTFELISPSRHTETAQDGLRTQTLDQIVRKAAIYLRNGQHEAKIDLKPEFLGHVRMQVITENHQVTVKILTETGFIKDMVENSIHQLKADLQQQGLSVDKLEVAVSSDSEDYKHPQEKADPTKDRPRGVASVNPENGEEEIRDQAGESGFGPGGATTVDYFA